MQNSFKKQNKTIVSLVIMTIILYNCSSVLIERGEVVCLLMLKGNKERIPEIRIATKIKEEQK